jgi:hypothetical protein
MCRSSVLLQFTLTDDGLAFLRINRGVIGHAPVGESLFSDEDLREVQEQCDDMLQFILGRSPTPPAPLPDPPPGVLQM